METISPRRRVYIVLIASLCLNLLLLGAVGAVVLRWHLHPEQEAARLALRQFTRQLDRDDARLMRHTFIRHRPQTQLANAQYRQALQTVIVDLQQTPRNEEQLQAAIREARTRREALADAGFDTLLNSLQDISPAGRDALLQGRP